MEVALGQRNKKTHFLIKKHKKLKSGLTYSFCTSLIVQNFQKDK